MAKPNYHFARRQKEMARKSRQEQKQQRKSAARAAPAADSDVKPAEAPEAASDVGTGSGQ